MTNKAKMTPEEKLLKIIENPAAIEKKVLPDIKKTVSAFTDWISSLRPKDGGHFRINMRIANRVLAIISACFALYIIIYLASEGSELGRRFNKLISGGGMPAIKQKESPEAATNAEVAPAEAKGRNIFTLTPKEKSIERSDLSGGAVELKLVGILWSDSPQAMIEDTKAQKTYLVNQLDKIGNVSVKAILVNKVVLTKDGQEWDLR